MVRKDEVEEQNRSLQSLLEQEMDTSSMLRADIADLKQSHQHQQEADLAKINKLQRCVCVCVCAYVRVCVCVCVHVYVKSCIVK